MIILYLGPFRPQIAAVLAANSAAIRHTEARLTVDSPVLDGVDWIVSYGYKYIIKEEILRLLPDRVINLHISYLPYNRGADPNLWSFLEDTPKGVTIHQIDPGIDTGKIVAQQEVAMTADDTLATSYERLSKAIESLFADTWPQLLSGTIRIIPQPAGGTFHKLKDKAPFEHLLTQGWNTPVHNLKGKAKMGEKRVRT